MIGSTKRLYIIKISCRSSSITNRMPHVRRANGPINMLNTWKNECWIGKVSVINTKRIRWALKRNDFVIILMNLRDFVRICFGNGWDKLGLRCFNSRWCFRIRLVTKTRWIDDFSFIFILIFINFELTQNSRT